MKPNPPQPKGNDTHKAYWPDKDSGYFTCTCPIGKDHLDPIKYDNPTQGGNDSSEDNAKAAYELAYRILKPYNVKMAVVDEVKAQITEVIEAACNTARLEEVKLCQGEKAVDKERYLRNRQWQLEHDIDTLRQKEEE